MHKNLMSKILDSPTAPIFLEELQSKLENEKKERIDFYNKITEQQKAEFINGTIIFHSPTKKMHIDVSGNLCQIIATFVVEYDLGFVGIEKILVQFTRNDYEPDLCFFDKEKAKKFKNEQSLFPVPDMVVEILSKGTASRDRGVKYDDYESHGVKEYWIIDPKKKMIEQYLNGNSGFELNLKSNSGEIKSIAIKNLTIPIKAVFSEKLTHQFVKGIFK